MISMKPIEGNWERLFPIQWDKLEEKEEQFRNQSKEKMVYDIAIINELDTGVITASNSS